jgi:hypothetical protein
MGLPFRKKQELLLLKFENTNPPVVCSIWSMGTGSNLPFIN